MTKLPYIQLKKFLHRKQHSIGISFDFNSKLIATVKKLPNVLWSVKHRIWYVNDTIENLKLIYIYFEDKAIINDSKYLKDKHTPRTLTDSQKTLLNNFFKYLRGKRYSKSTLDCYVTYIADFIDYHTAIPIENLTNRDVELYIETIYIKRKYSISTQRQFISALKLFIVFEPSTQIDGLELVRPYRSRKLPIVLSQEEIITLITRAKNLKHRVIIALLYSAGLRISELINLKIKNININRRQILIKNSKGRKDRYVSLAESILPLLQNYLMTYRPDLYIVEGKPSVQYTSSSVRKFLKKYAFQGQITTRVTPHILRHSYATHLIENGVGLRHIQELLGHSKPETTMIYTHVARKDLLEIKSPLDHAIDQFKKSHNAEQKFLLSGK
ncbi:integrase [Flavobacteriales bacterium 33_180_T64]|nr:integrase [Flavobacteriales bacterium 33_180_T64]